MRKIALILVVATIIVTSNALAAAHSAAAFKKLQGLAGEWEGMDEKRRPVKTSFKSIVSNTGVMETLSP